MSAVDRSLHWTLSKLLSGTSSSILASYLDFLSWILSHSFGERREDIPCDALLDA